MQNFELFSDFDDKLFFTDSNFVFWDNNQVFRTPVDQFWHLLCLW